MATKKVRFSKVYQTMYALPMAIASSPAAAIFLFIYRQKNGLLNNILGTEIAWTNEMPHAIWAVCAMTIWMHIGVSFIFLLVGFRNVPEDLLESALLDGAGPFRRIKDIIIPMASPQIFFVLFLNIGSSFKSFAQIRLLTQGGPANQTKTLIYYIYENAIINGRFETGLRAGPVPVWADLPVHQDPVRPGEKGGALPMITPHQKKIAGEISSFALKTIIGILSFLR